VFFQLLVEPEAVPRLVVELAVSAVVAEALTQELAAAMEAVAVESEAMAGIGIQKLVVLVESQGAMVEDKPTPECSIM
jgi:hypothetical protein